MDNQIQIRLFNAVAQQFKNRTKAIADYRLRFPGSSESTARARFTGITSITYSHGMEVAAAYQLHDLDIWPEGWPHTKLYAQVPISGENIGFYLDLLHHDLISLHKNAQSRLHISVDDVSFLFLMHYRRLIGFSLYCSLSLEMNKIFNHAGIVTNTLIIAEENKDEAAFCYEERGLAHLLRFKGEAAQNKLNAVENAGQFGGHLGSALEKTFFVQLRQSLEV